MKKKIIIVGASSGIGRKMAELYAMQGHRVGITGRRLELLQEIRLLYPEQIETACFDVTGTENITQLESLVRALGGLDLLVISAGTGDPSEEINWQIDKTTIDTNVTGFTEIADWAYNYFDKNGGGQLAGISSIAAVRGGRWAPAYNASKSFQSHYLEGLSIKAYRTKKNIRITCLEPGFVDTKMAKSELLFWVVPVEKAARQIIRAIEKGKRKAYISRRWWIIGKIMKWTPFWLFKRLG